MHRSNGNPTFVSNAALEENSSNKLEFNEEKFLKFIENQPTLIPVARLGIEAQSNEEKVDNSQATLVQVESKDTSHLPSEKAKLETVAVSYENVPDSFPFNIYEAYRIRIISFANGAINAIKHEALTKKEDTADQSRAKKDIAIKNIKNLLEKKLKELDSFEVKMKKFDKNPDFSTELYQFYNEDLPKASGLKPKQIALAEAMYVWQHVPRPIRVTRYNKPLENGDGYLRIEQREVPHSSELTDIQKKELTRIFSDNTPDWFKKLDPFAKNILRNLLKPDGVTINWDNYRKCHPTILRHIPGEANASTHYLTVTHVKSNGEETVLSKTVSIRQGVPSSFNMKNNEERESSARENLKQMLTADKIIKAQEIFHKKWGISAEDNCKLPILLGGLLTPRDQANTKGILIDIKPPFLNSMSGAENNTLLTRDKKKAILAWQTANPQLQDSVELFNLNVGVNALRRGVVLPDKSFINYVAKLSKTITKKIPDEKNHTIRLSRTKKLNRLYAGLTALENLDGKRSTFAKRNENLYTAALYDAVTRLMYGYDTGNCKSSKDRKGVEIIMADAMLVYLAEQEALGKVGAELRFPSINDGDPERERFVKIFCELYASGLQLLVANDNSPGCPGIKDEGILDKDIVDELQRMQRNKQVPKKEIVNEEDLNGIYAQSKLLANLNKPGSFWKKHRSKILYGSMFGLSVILGVTSAILIGSGVFSPLGVIGFAAAAQLGTAALPIGWAANIAIAMAGGAGLAELGYLARNGVEAKRDRSKTFEAQIKKFSASEPKFGADISKSSTALVSENFPLEPSKLPISQVTYVETQTAKQSKQDKMTYISQTLLTPIIEKVCNQWDSAIKEKANHSISYTSNDSTEYTINTSDDNQPADIQMYLMHLIQKEITRERIISTANNTHSATHFQPNLSSKNIDKIINEIVPDLLNKELQKRYPDKFPAFSEQYAKTNAAKR